MSYSPAIKGRISMLESDMKALDTQKFAVPGLQISCALSGAVPSANFLQKMRALFPDIESFSVRVDRLMQGEIPAAFKKRAKELSAMAAKFQNRMGIILSWLDDTNEDDSDDDPITIEPDRPSPSAKKTIVPTKTAV